MLHRPAISPVGQGLLSSLRTTLKFLSACGLPHTVLGVGASAATPGPQAQQQGQQQQPMQHYGYMAGCQPVVAEVGFQQDADTIALINSRVECDEADDRAVSDR